MQHARCASDPPFRALRHPAFVAGSSSRGRLAPGFSGQDEILERDVVVGEALAWAQVVDPQADIEGAESTVDALLAA